MTTAKILLIAPNGQVGWELNRCLQPLGRVVSTGRQGAELALDLTQPDAIRAVVQRVRPQIIVNAGAYTAVDKAEEEIELAQQLNAVAPGVLAEEAKSCDAWLLHYSTDYVFDGSYTRPYCETDPVNPIGVYGATKLAGEQAIQATAVQHLILRTAWVYGTRGKNFMLTMQRLAQERDELRVVADQIGAPTASRMIAQGTAQIITQLLAPHNNTTAELSGIYHLTCAGQCSWYDFACAIVNRGEKVPKMTAITTADYPTPAKRPAYSVLNNSKLAECFGVQLPNWRIALNLCLQDQYG